MDQRLMKVNVKLIKVGDYEQRHAIDAEGIDDLSESIGRIGLLNPIHVCYVNNEYVLVAGHRRLAAVIKLGWEQIDCLVVKSDQNDSMEEAFAENFFRKDLSPVELACAMADCVNKGSQTIEQLSRGFHRSQEWVRRYLAIVSWPADILELVHHGKVSMSAAANLALIEDETYRTFLGEQAEVNGATARVTASWLQAWRSAIPADEALNRPPAAGAERQRPILPQSPCVACGSVNRTDAMSLVLICTGCLGAIRNAMAGG